MRLLLKRLRLKRLLTGLLATAIVIPLTGWIWLGSDSGRAWLADTVAEASGGGVSLEGLHGHPLSRLEIDDIIYRDAATAVNVHNAVLAWSPWRLLFATLKIGELSAGRIDVRLSEATAEPERQAPAEGTPFIPAIALDRLSIDAVTITKPDDSVLHIEAITGARLRLSRSLGGELAARIAEPAIDTRLALAGTLKQWQLTGSATGNDLGQIDLSMQGNQLASGRIEVNARKPNQAPNKLQAESSNEGANAQGTQEAALAANWQRHGERIEAEGTLSASTPELSLASSWQLYADTALPAAHWQFDGTLTGAALTRPVQLSMQGKYVDAALQFAIAEPDRGLQFTGHFVDNQARAELGLKAWQSPLKAAAGQLTGTINATLNTENNEWQLAGNIGKGELAGMHASLDLDGKGTGSQWQLKRCDARLLGTMLTAHGHGDDQAFELTGSARSSDIGRLLKLAGSKQGSGTLDATFNGHGPFQAPEVAFDASLRHFRMDDLAIATLDLDGTLAKHAGRAQLKLSKLQAAGAEQIRRLNLVANLKGEQLDLLLNTHGRLEAVTRGRIDLATEQAQLNGLKIAYEQTELLKAKELRFSRHGREYRMEPASFQLLGAATVAGFAIGGDQALVKLDIDGLALERAKPWLAALPYSLQGRSDLHLDLQGAANTPHLSIDVRAPHLRVAHAMFADRPDQALALSNLQLHGAFADGRMQWRIHADTPAEGTIDSSGDYALLFSLDPWRVAAPARHQGEGTFKAHLAQLADLQPVIPRIAPLEGSSDIDLKWHTPVGIDSLIGGGELRFDALGVPEFGLEMQGDMHAQLNKGKPPVVSLNLKNGDGKLHAKGPVDIEQQMLPAIHMRQFPLMALPDQQLTVSGDIRAAQEEDIGTIAGQLAVTHLYLEIPEPAPGPTADLQWHASKETKQDKKTEAFTRLDIDLDLGDDAEIFGRGLDIKPQGKLHLGGSLSAPQLTGPLTIASGKVEYRSIKLDIQPESQVSFSGDPARPLVAIKAARTIGDITAGISIDGPADRLTTTLYSTPAMSNAEIFSYIATGRPLSTLGKDSAGDVMTAAEFILGPGSMMNEVQGKVKQSTGLDIFEVGGDSSGGNVKAGRNLSDKLSVTVEQTVSKESSTALTLQYLLTKSLSVFAKQTTKMAPSVGLRYSKEWFGKQPKTSPKP